jgi:hypothetical protein
MTALKDIIDTDWDTDNVSKPTLIEAPERTRFFYLRVVSFRRVEKIENYMDIFSRGYYSPESHDAYECYVGSTTESDAEDIIDEVRRICAQFSPSGDDKILTWEGGSWVVTTPYCWEFRFIVMKKKSGATLPNT